MQITVNGQSIAIVDDTLVSNSVNIYECEFEFDASWDGFAKTSVWQLNSDDPIEVVINSGVAVIPHEVLENAGILRIGVYGTKDEKVMPTVWLEKRKVCLGTPTGAIGTEPTPSIYAQILAVATNAENVANEVKTEWESVSATAETLEPTESASVVFEDNTFKFGIPQGARGADGTDGVGIESILKTSTSGLVDTYTITYTNGTTSTFTVTNGAKGDTGNGISNIAKTGTSGLVDTYTITFTNGATTTFTVTNGEKGDKGDTGATGNGISSITKTATVGKVDTYTITYTDGTTTTFDVTNGEVTEASLEERLIDKADVILNSANGSIASFSDGANMPVKSLEVEINAVQSGSGDPSPTNIRPISGRDAVNVYVSPTTDAEDGTTYPISLGSTVYGGVLDVTSGVLTVDKAIVDLGTLNYSLRGNVGMQSNGLSSVIKNPADNYTLPDVVCSIATQNTWQMLVNGGTNSGYVGVSGGYICIATSETNPTTFKTAVSGQTLAYPLATPTTIQLTPTEVQTLLGDNNIFADSGEVSVTYRADTKAYIDGTIVDVPLAMIAPIESGTKSSKAYAVGEYFILGGTQFCKAKTAIASGATFTLNTNYTITTIGAELKALQ